MVASSAPIDVLNPDSLFAQRKKPCAGIDLPVPITATESSLPLLILFLNFQPAIGIDELVGLYNSMKSWRAVAPLIWISLITGWLVVGGNSAEAVKVFPEEAAESDK